MIGLLWRLLVGRFAGCTHQWSLHREISVWDGGSRPVATKYVLRCDHCGNFKSKEI